MSRVADARHKAGHPEAPRLATVDGVTVEPPRDLEVVDIVVPWKVDEADTDSEPEQAVLRPRLVASEPVRHDRPDFVELVQRVFHPDSNEPTARTVTFLPISATGDRRIGLDVAHTLASLSAGTICIADANFGSGALHEMAGIPAGPGLCDALLAGRPPSQVAVPIGRQMWLIPSGLEICAGPGWPSQAFARAVRQLAGRFDFVLVQAPPLDRESAMSTLLAVAPATDGVVLMVDMDRTRRDVAGDIVNHLRASGVSVVGAVVLNSTGIASSRTRRR